MNKSYSVLLILLFTQTVIFAQLPAVFNGDDEKRASHSEMIKTYLTPTRIVWKSDDSGYHIKNENTLLEKGNGQVAVNDENLFRLISNKDHKPGIMLDFGKEINGGIKISMGIRPSKTPLRLRIRFGESVSEAMSNIGGKSNATNEHSLRDFTLEVPWLGSVEIGETGFRFVRIDVLDANENAPIKSIEAAFVYRDLEYVGSFDSNNKIKD